MEATSEELVDIQSNELTDEEQEQLVNEALEKLMEEELEKLLEAEIAKAKLEETQKLQEPQKQQENPLSHSQANIPVEYVNKKATYIFPPKSNIFDMGGNILVEIKNRKTRNIAPYLANKVYINEGYNYKFALPITGMGSNLIKEYETISAYFAKHSKISFYQFEHATSREIALCTFFRPMDFVKAGNIISELVRSMPSLINIFRRPLIHLRQAEIIQPVDAVKRVNHLTVRHLSLHSECWKDIDKKKNEIIPSKLLTRVYEDDYSIYENVVFRDLIDEIQNFLRKRIYYLTEILETFKESIQLDAVNRFNHQKYYLAIGKLYVGFYKMENSSEIQSTLETIKVLYKQINQYKNRAVYTKNANMKAISGEIKRTNILTMHKDYRNVLSLFQMFKKNTAESKDPGNLNDQVNAQKAYEHFCEILTVFAVTNFNLDCLTDEAIFQDGKLNAEFEYKDWKMTLKNEYSSILDFNTIVMTANHQKTSKQFLLIPISYYISGDKKRHFEQIVKRLYRTGKKYDKYVFLEPFETNDNSFNSYCMPYNLDNNTLQYAVLPISITEINSFRRIQKLVLEALVLTNESHDTCAFCGEPLSKDSANSYLCRKCKMAVKKMSCQHCGKDFTATYVAVRNNPSNKKQLDEETLNALPEFFRQEKQYLFRNIVNMNKNNFICPHCNGENDSRTAQGI